MNVRHLHLHNASHGTHHLAEAVYQVRHVPRHVLFRAGIDKEHLLPSALYDEVRIFSAEHASAAGSPGVQNLDLGLIAGTFYAGIMLAWIGSIGNSIKGLGETVPDGPPLSATILADENAAPPKD
jgi:hypothetical protein